jgi:hypothetical protein
MAHTNAKLAPEVDTVFFMTALEHSYLSSSLVKEIAAFGGDVSQMVPPSRFAGVWRPGPGSIIEPTGSPCTPAQGGPDR